MTNLHLGRIDHHLLAGKRASPSSSIRVNITWANDANCPRDVKYMPVPLSSLSRHAEFRSLAIRKGPALESSTLREPLRTKRRVCQPVTSVQYICTPWGLRQNIALFGYLHKVSPSFGEIPDIAYQASGAGHDFAEHGSADGRYQANRGESIVPAVHRRAVDVLAGGDGPRVGEACWTTLPAIPVSTSANPEI